MNSLPLDIVIRICTELPLRDIPIIARINAVFKRAIDQDLHWMQRISSFGKMTEFHEQYELSGENSWKQFFKYQFMNKRRPILLVSCDTLDTYTEVWKERLEQMGFLQVTTLNLHSGATPTSFNVNLELKKYAVVFFSSNYLPDQNEWGDALASFIEDNSISTPRCVILTVYANLTNYNLLGRWPVKQYDPWLPGNYNDQASHELSLGSFSSSHPIMKGVKYIGGGQATMINSNLSSESVDIARTTENISLIVEKRISRFAKVIGMNFYPPNINEQFWNSDGSLMISNTFQYACSIQFHK